MIQHLLKSVHTKNKNVLKLSFSFIYFLLFYSIAHGQVPNLDEGKFHLQIHENEQKTNTKASIYYMPKKNEKIECLEIKMIDKYGNGEEEYKRVTTINNFLTSSITIPENTKKIWVCALGNATCFTGGISYTTFNIHDDENILIENFIKELGQLYSTGNSTKIDSLLKIKFKANLYDYTYCKSIVDWLKNKNKIDEIKRLYIEITKDNNDSSDAFAILTYIDIILGRFDDSLNNIQILIEKSKEISYLPTLFNKLSYEFYASQRDNSILSEYKKKAALKFPLSTLSVNFIEATIIKNKNVKNDDELDLVKNLINEMIKNDEKYNFLKAKFEYEINNNCQDAFTAAEKFIKLTDNDSFVSNYRSIQTNRLIDMYIIASNFLILGKNYDKAIDYLKRTIEINTNPEKLKELYMLSAQCYAKKGEESNYEEYIMRTFSINGFNEIKNYLSNCVTDLTFDVLVNKYYNKSAKYCEKIEAINIQTDNNLYSIGNGEILLIHFWGPGCIPCIREIPELNKFRRSIRSDKIKWLATKFSDQYYNKLPNKLGIL